MALNFRNNSSKQSFLLPPRSPFPTIPSSYADPGPISKPGPKPVNPQRAHQRNASESFIDEQPSWLDDLLNEPDSLTGSEPVKRGAHRRSSSDSFALFSNNGFGDNGNNNNGFSGNWVNGLVDAKPFYPDPNLKGRVNSWVKGNVQGKSAEVAQSDSLEEQKVEKKENKPSEADTKRAKQQYAQRSRVRKLQYIAELERKVQSLQTEGMEATAELEFLSQQNIMLDLENKALKQRLENLNQEHLIKRFQQEMFERELGRLRTIYQQQQQQMQHQQPQSGATHNRSNSRENLNLDSQFHNRTNSRENLNLDSQFHNRTSSRENLNLESQFHNRTSSRENLNLDSQFSNLSLKHKDSSSNVNPNGPLRI